MHAALTSSPVLLQANGILGGVLTAGLAGGTIPVAEEEPSLKSNPALTQVRVSTIAIARRRTLRPDGIAFVRRCPCKSLPPFQDSARCIGRQAKPCRRPWPPDRRPSPQVFVCEKSD